MQKNQNDNTDFKTWFENLDKNVKVQIHSLHQKDMKWNWVLVFFVLLWLFGAYLILSFSSFFVHLIGYVIIGLCIHGMANLMHECIHNNLFNKKIYNWMYGYVSGIPALFSITAYKVNHLQHHQFTGSEKDPDELYNISSNKFVLTILFYVILFLGVFLYLIHVPVNALRFGNNRERLQVLTEYVIMFAVYATIVTLSLNYSWFYVLLHCWLIPIPFAAFYGNVRGWAEHMLTEKTHPLLNTRTVTSNSVFSFLNINLNYHLEHHLFPKIPWYNLPKLHKILLPEYKKANVTVYSSYVKFLADAFMAGPHKLI